LVVLSSLTHLFTLLTNFSEGKNPFAPIIYKTLTLAMIENHQNSNIREFLMHNFIEIFSKIESIPLSILLDPLVRQI